jgi:hypothetical protein
MTAGACSHVPGNTADITSEGGQGEASQGGGSLNARHEPRPRSCRTNHRRGDPVIAWTAAGGLAVSDDLTALDNLAGTWTGLYDVGYADGEFHALRLTGGPLLTADTPGGLDSAIRADFTRWIAA